MTRLEKAACFGSLTLLAVVFVGAALTAPQRRVAREARDLVKCGPGARWTVVRTDTIGFDVSITMIGSIGVGDAQPRTRDAYGCVPKDRP